MQVKDLDIHEIDGVDPNTSVKEAWTKMREGGHKTMSVLKEGELVGIISTGDIVKSYMDVYDSRSLSNARIQYKNIIDALEGTLVTGNKNGYFSKGKVAIAASSSSLMAEFIEKDDLVILSNRYEAQECAIDIDASCLVICIGDNSRMYLSSVYNISKNAEEIRLKGVVSRKKQLISALVEAIQQHNQNNE